MNNSQMNFSSPNQFPTKTSYNHKIVVIIIAIIIVAVISIVLLLQSNKETKDNSNNNKNSSTNTHENSTNNTNANPESNKTTNPSVTVGKIDPNTNLTYDENGAFQMYIEDVFTITDKGTVVTGRISRGTIYVGDEIQIIGIDGNVINTKVADIEQFRKSISSAKVGENVGINLEGVTREQVQRGMTVIKPNSMIATTNFQGTLHVYSKEEGGRHTSFFNNYRPQVYIVVADITGTIQLPEGVEMVSPGEDTTVSIQLDSPVAMEVGTKFTIREGGRTVGDGVITKVG